ARYLHDVRLAFIPHDGVEHLFDLLEAAELLALRPALCVADRAFQIAVVADFYERQTRMLLMVRAQPAIVRAAPLDRRVVTIRHLRRFDEHFARAAVIIDVVGDEDAFCAVLRAAFEQKDISVLENDLALDLAVTGRADGDRNIVVKIWARTISHYFQPF